MEFINEANSASLNEPRKEQLLEQEHFISQLGGLPITLAMGEIVDPFESEDDDLALFGVGGPA
jgi:hypothetical protein